LKIIIEELEPGDEEHIIVRCHQIHPELMRALNAHKMQRAMLVAYKDSEIHRINPTDVFYIESVDNRTFLYCEREVYESKQKLYELEEALALGDFLRISKSTILNLRKVKSLMPAFSGRLEAVLRNGERVPISRHYVRELKKVLGI
jgi:DNA-binding LytR/AlgR family response regulator